ncbi:type VI secretion system protein TssA [Acinetobacter indicus]|uniref:type VI secretion system protein TssA n=1 Tax=Acinetobacter TaxID=469 RepID=UPI000FD8AF8B|nr:MULTISPECIES: type VI secretion system protein TssA [Acinetobacter]MDM1261935.1 type VI secretion system protein TssA [Acinetobacter indicus]MDM1276893.1 type VI secretion system protein TssA [Acinetobacter indicus]MDM1279383.1 type VI secretion system protein TssA [Acinetobacter indicus]MDO4578771.1 type VI secretion system protein TssA [Acinetobacter sp.]QLB59352.1 type VI secretion system protein TssA [Acinetobacter indicus]
MNLNLDVLLHPISAEQPCGEDYSFSNEFHAIKKAKTQDDPLLDQGDWVSEPKQADWGFVHSKSTELLESKTKDIRLYGWLLEAWSNLYGFEGIAQAIQLSHRSLNEYWLQLHPEIEDDDLDQRIGLLQGLINQIPVLIKTVPIVTAPHLSLRDYDNFLYQDNLRRKQSEDSSDQSAAPQLEQFDQALLNTSKSLQYQNYQHFLDILQQWSSLKEVLDQLMGLDAPSFAAIDSQLDSIHSTLKKLYKTDAFAAQTLVEASEQNNIVTADAINATAAPAIAMPIMNAPTGFQPQPQNHLANREQAMQVLQEIADYFQANEPHSPVSYMLQKTIKWSQMPLHEWLTQVIKNDNPLENIQELLGVQSSNETNSDW